MLFLRTFGGLSLENGGRPITGAAAQRGRLAILAVLAVAGDSGISRDRLLTVFWPESDSERARGALKQALYALRRDVGEQELTLGTSELRLNSQVIASDVAEFQSALKASDLETAAGRYTGLFLDGIHVKDAPEFERWVDRERDRLAHEHRSAVERLAQAAGEKGNVSGAVDWWRKLAAVDPLSARVARAFMQALVVAGSPEAAIRHARLYAEVTRAELGADPDPTVAELAEQLRATNGVGSSQILAPSGVVVAEPSRLSPGAVALESTTASASSNLRPTGRHHVRRVVSLSVAAAFVAAASLAIRAFHSQPQPGLVAVAPMQNRTGDSSLDRLAELAGRQITGQLVQSGRVDVVDLRNVGAGGAPADSDSKRLRQAKAAGAERMVSSTMYRRGDSIIIHSQIVRTADGRVIGEIDPIIGSSENIAKALYELRQRVGGAVAALADTLYRPWSQAHSRMPAYAAFQEFIQGLDGLIDGKDVLEHLTNAATLDTNFIEAKIWLIRQSDTDRDAYVFTDSVQRAAIAQRGQLSPFDAASLDRVIAYRIRDWDAVYRASQRLMAIAPKTQDAQLALAEAAMQTRHYAEAIRLFHKLHPSVGWMGGSAKDGWLQSDAEMHHALGDYSGALEHWRALRNRNPSYNVCVRGANQYAVLGDELRVDSLIAECAGLPDAPPQIPKRGYLNAILHYLEMGNVAAAKRAAQFILPTFAALAETQPARRRDLGAIYCMLGDWEAGYANLLASIDLRDPDARVNLAVAAGHVGDTATVSATLRWLSDHPMRARRHGLFAQWRAIVLLASGDRESAIAELREAMTTGDLSPWAWRFWWQLAPLRGDARFNALTAPLMN